MKTSIYNLLAEYVGPDNILLNEGMSGHTSFRIGGPAAGFVMPNTVQELDDVIRLCRREGIQYFVMGNGTNLLVSDKGYNGIVIQLCKRMNAFFLEDTMIYAQAGVLLSALAAKAARESLTGLEFASGIPGTIGGACVMNAGAYGGEMKDVIISVEVYIPGKGVMTIPAEEMKFGYRDSVIKHSDYIVTGATLKLEKGEKSVIDARMEELKEARTSKQPLEYPSAGSTFKRPEGYFAGKLIQDAGLKGLSVGGAQVSEKHSGFIINKGGATAADVVGLIEKVSDTVYEKYSVRLEPEVLFLGFDK